MTVTTMKRLVRLASNVLTLLAAVVFAGLAIGPHTGAYRTLTVLSGSMSPSIPPGSVVAVAPTDPADLTEGMVITYAIPVEDKRVVTHRVTDIIKGGEHPIVQTKGDANDVADAWIAQLDGGPVWTHRATVPYLGFGISFLRQPAVRKVTVLATPLIFLLVTLGQIWTGSPSAEKPAEPVARKRKRRAKPAQAWLVSDSLPRRPGPRLATAALTLVVLIVGTGIVGVLFAAPALALFRSTVTAQQSIATGQLTTPEGVTATCGGTRIDVAWTAVNDGLTTGYTIWRSTGGAFQELGAVSGATTTTYRDSALVAKATQTYQVRSVRGTWSSSASASSNQILVGGGGRC